MGKITVTANVSAPVEKVWDCWTLPQHVIKWNNASDDWHTPHAQNDLRVGGKFLSRMESKDGSMGFDFEGLYTAVIKHKLIEYVMPDGRRVSVSFNPDGNETEIIETFDAENVNSDERQRSGWQSILDNFKSYAENNK